MPPKNTAALLDRLRSLMKNAKHVHEPIHAYIVPTGDAHVSEYIADCDKRREFISGFSGSNGTAIVTSSKAALWTDGRYFLQAEAQMDSNWTLMKDGLTETPSQGDWLCDVLPTSGRVGVDPFLMSAVAWEALNKKLQSEGLDLIPVKDNLIDLVWEDQPPRPNNRIFTQALKWTGQTWDEKISSLREKISQKKCSMIVLSALDDVAWLLNLRGSDIDFNPVFFSYVIVTMENVYLFVDERKLTPDIRTHLRMGEEDKKGVILKPYESIRPELESLMKMIKPATKAWVTPSINYALLSAIPEKERYKDVSPVAVMKSVKSPAEIQGMRNAHIKDAVALCEYLMWLENEVPKGCLTEISASDHLEKLRSQQDEYVSLSFDTISGFGSNGAIIHYRSSPETDRLLTTEELYLCDSGAQFRDGTTDVTRTVHFGTPSQHEKDCFTRVLKGHISLSHVIFPNGTKGPLLDTLARTSLWANGLDYLHGTGHGVGSFLNVHEGPMGIGYRPRPDDIPLKEGNILSNEPGYYEDGKFGIRIESLCLVVKATTKYNFNDKGFLTFEPITLVPIQSKLINPALLSESEIQWLNDYHQKTRDVIGPALLEQGRKEVYNWLIKNTQPLG
ncbi:hypothetical protein CAPTEDRAFT_169985 [Capitella teleta]|uniref:Xaa-Pro aminopeptidase 1 n=1 Tax=Capitella teleta TaxID=283909 RepID=R7VEY9_CAPTE|nr:hypothetical protein CAPTEDRAFT_169985 [Capitella teleta]|eukprot:ELU14220.1 hypothetical protein CAPTEDRAFT_169985 [Capitella teleta]